MDGILGSTAVVVGGSRGIGREIAERLGREGANVVVNYLRNKELAEDTASHIRSGGGQAVLAQADISHIDQIASIFDVAERTFGPVDIAMVNAGTAVVKPLAEISEAEYDSVFATNAKGPFFVLQVCARRMSDGGRIVVTSTGGTKMLIPGNSVYLGSKGAVEQFVRTFAQEVADRGITVNAIQPGYTDTDLIPDRDRDVAAAASPFKRIGSPQEVADAAVFLASSDARWVTGQLLGAAGGVF